MTGVAPVPYTTRCHECHTWLDEGELAQDRGDHYLCFSCVPPERCDLAEGVHTDAGRLAAIRDVLNTSSYQKDGDTYSKYHDFVVKLLTLARGFEEDNI